MAQLVLQVRKRELATLQAARTICECLHRWVQDKDAQTAADTLGVILQTYSSSRGIIATSEAGRENSENSADETEPNGNSAV